MKAAEVPVSAATVPLLMQAISDTNSSVAMVADVVSSDTGLAARVLALANSAAFGLSRQVTEIPQAVSLVGANMAQTLAIAGSCRLLDGSGGLGHSRDHALRMACTTRAIAARTGLNKAEAFAAGLLHDVGEILLWQRDPEPYAAAHADWPDAESQLRSERAMYGTDHALVAREQLSEWQLPGSVVDAVGDHHRPDLRYPDLPTAVIAAEELVEHHMEWSPRYEVFGLAPADIPGLRTEIDEQVTEMGGLLAC